MWLQLHGELIPDLLSLTDYGPISQKATCFHHKCILVLHFYYFDLETNLVEFILNFESKIFIHYLILIFHYMLDRLNY